MSDPEAETRDARGTLLRQLVERVGGEPERMRERLHELEQDVEQRMTRIVQEEGEEAMEALSRRVSSELERLVPGGSVMLEARPPAVQMPAVGFGMRVADSGLQTEVGRQGHGFQRALLIALVQQMPATSEDSQAPSLFLAMEEPELYQHPLQARHFGQMLNELADSNAGGVQVAYATHSEHFVDPERYPSLRRFRRRSSDEDFPEAEATAATLERVQARLAGVIRPEEVLMRVRVTLRRRLAEAIFARAVVLVEGYTDAGFLHGLADRQAGFDAAGVSVVAGMGKRQLLLPWAILHELEVPTYLIFDGDADIEKRMLADGKERSAAAQALAQHKRDNELILKVLGEEPEELPETRVTERYAALETSLEGEFSAWGPFGERLAACKQELGDWREKSEDAYRQAAAETAEQPPDTFAEILRSVLALAQ